MRTLVVLVALGFGTVALPTGYEALHGPANAGCNGALVIGGTAGHLTATCNGVVGTIESVTR